MKKFFEYVAKVFGQDDARVVSVKTSIAYTLTLTTVALWIWSMATGREIPNVASWTSMYTVVLISYFGAAVVKHVANKVNGKK